MKRSVPRRPSPATAIASVSLFVSLGGVSYGVATNSIDSREIKNNSVRTKDLRNNDVRSGDIRSGAVASSDIKNDGVTGTDVLESSLAKVPSAGTADNAGTAGSADTAGTAQNADTVDGVNAARMFFRAPDGTGPTEVLNLGGLVIHADCTPGDNVDAVVTTTVSDSVLYSASIDAFFDAVDNTESEADFDVGETVELATDDASQVGSFRYVTQSGSVVTGSWTAEDDFPGTTCMFAGHALQSGG